MSVLYIRDESGKFKAITTITGEKGEKGEAFTYDDFTPEQLESLRGPAGVAGPVGPVGPPGPRGEPATPVVDEVLPDGTDAISGAAVATYVDIRVAQLGLYVLITGQPVPMTVNKGETATFTVSAVGKGLTYQWQYSTNNGEGWTDSGKDGNKEATLWFVTDHHNGYLYRCVITDANGNKAITEPVILTVIAPIVITKQPQSQAAVAGDTATFHVEATGVASYQWQILGTGGNWNNLTWNGATTATMTHVLNESNAQRQYRCKLTGTDGSVVYTDVVYFAPILVTKQPENATGSIGDTVTFSIGATGYISMYRWQRSTDGGTTFSPVYWGNSGFDTDTFTFAITDDGRLKGMYRCVVYCSKGDEYNVISDVVSITST